MFIPLSLCLHLERLFHNQTLNKKSDQMSTLYGKVAVVTGGNSGIGFASAKELKNKGATVVITGRDAGRVRDAAKELEVLGIVADVKSMSAIEDLVNQVKSEVGYVDILFVNAGIFQPAPVGQITEEMFDHQMGINFKGAVFTTEKFLPILNDGASIINLSSVNAYTGMPNTAVYAASKAALNAYTRTAATELAPRKIRINSVNPGPVSTSIFSKTGMSEEQLNGFAQAMQNRVPLKRFGQPEDIAKLVAFLASDDASFITGSEYNIDGGININPGIS
jgi:NAD(P)-dependent dehydrogenase (short-subunit alcohol dehydrogenase family)